MAQDFPAGLRSILAEVGQAAIEVDCGVEGFREFVTVFRCDTARMGNFGNRFPYMRSHPVVFRVMRFRVEATLIDNHIETIPTITDALTAHSRRDIPGRATADTTDRSMAPPQPVPGWRAIRGLAGKPPGLSGAVPERLP